MEKFQCELEDEHPSLDGSVPRRLDDDGLMSGSEKVTQELDLFNLKYQRLCEAARDKLQQIGEENPDDPEIQVS